MVLDEGRRERQGMFIKMCSRLREVDSMKTSCRVLSEACSTHRPSKSTSEKMYVTCFRHCQERSTAYVARGIPKVTSGNLLEVPPGYPGGTPRHPRVHWGYPRDTHKVLQRIHYVLSKEWKLKHGGLNATTPLNIGAQTQKLITEGGTPIRQPTRRPMNPRRQLNRIPHQPAQPPIHSLTHPLRHPRQYY
jgi:hypothetical protein